MRTTRAIRDFVLGAVETGRSLYAAWRARKDRQTEAAHDPDRDERLRRSAAEEARERARRERESTR